MIEAAAAGFDAALVFEASAEGRIKTERKGVGIFDIVVHGVEGHAGLDPDKGVSAIDEMARLILQVHGAETSLPARRSTSARLRAAHGSNASRPGRADARVDVRVASQAEMDRVDALFAGLAAHDSQARGRGVGSGSPCHAALGSDCAALCACAAGGGTDRHRGRRDLGWRSDGNFVAAMGIPVSMAWALSATVRTLGMSGSASME